MAYTKTNWSNGEAPAIDDIHLNKIEQGIYDATYVDGVKVGTSIDSNYKTNIIKGKNLFDYNDFLERNNLSINDDIISSTSIAVTTWTYSNCNYYITLEPGTYTISLFFTNQETSSSSGCRVLNSSENFLLNLGGSSMANVDKVTGTFSINTEQNIGVMLKLSNGTLKLQIEKGNGTSTYEKYITPTINVDGDNIYKKEKNEIYTTYEQRIGTWIDGKPIYRKVIALGSLPNNTYKEISTGLINTNISLTKIYGFAYTSTRDSQVALGDIYTRFEVRSGNNVIRVTTTANYSAYTGYAVLEYTKTTD